MNLAIYCSNLNQLHFFLRFFHIFKQKTYTVVFWSNRLSVISKARSNGCEAVLLSGYEYGNDDCLTSTPGQWYKPDRGLVPTHVSKKRVKRYIAAADQFFEQYQPNMLWIWNGSNQTCQTLYEAAKKHGIYRTLFFDIGNFPGKLFVDTKGINCRSWYAEHHAELRDNDVNISAFHEWKACYLATKLNTHVVPQAKNISRFNYSYLVDLLGFWFFGAITVEKLAPFGKVVDYFKRRTLQIQYDEFIPEENPDFIFFPLQVSTDSQVLWNCDITQADALRLAANSAKQEGRKLVVKPHPAEPHWGALNDVIQLKEELGFYLVDGNTFTVLKHCGRVMTINSTVGLEALLLGKPVQIIGRALYDGFDERDIAIYLQEYLLNIDYFSSEPITENQFNSIMKRSKLADLFP